MSDDPLRQEIISGWQEAGFRILAGVFSKAEVAALQNALADSAIAGSRAGARHLLGEPAVLRAARDPRLSAIAGEALGDEALAFRATLFDKSLRANWLVVWHQDTALPLRSRRAVRGWGPWSMKAGILYAHAPAETLSRIIAIRLHLDDSLASNGPLRVLPGTHTKGVLSDERIGELARTGPPFECLVAKGGLMTMSPLLVHASSKAAVPSSRRVLHIEYATSLLLEGGLELDVA